MTLHDEDESTNQNQGILIHEEMSQVVSCSERTLSQPGSCSERTISQIGFQEEQSKPFLNVQHSTYNQAESSLYQSREDMVKKLYHKRKLSLNENFKLMQEARRSTYT